MSEQAIGHFIVSGMFLIASVLAMMGYLEDPIFNIAFFLICGTVANLILTIITEYRK